MELGFCSNIAMHFTQIREHVTKNEAGSYKSYNCLPLLAAKEQTTLSQPGTKKARLRTGREAGNLPRGAPHMNNLVMIPGPSGCV